MNNGPEQPLSLRTTTLFLGLFLLLGLALRVAAARNGLWTDEAWSVVYAHEAGGPLGVITAINHDNNHHINSWWLQLVGADASSLAARSLSILCGTLSILIAGLIGLRRGRLVGLITALLFTVSPIMVLYGSEARGYAPMLLAFLLAIWRTEVWMQMPAAPFPRVTLALLTLVGTLSHLLMLPAMVLLGLWVWSVEARRATAKQGFEKAFSALLPAGIAALLVVVMILMMAALSPGGMRVGGYTPFGWGLYLSAMGDLAGWISGFGQTAGSLWVAGGMVLITAAALILFPAHIDQSRKALYLILIVTIPVLILMFRPGNSQFARYHLPLALGFILMAGDWAGTMLGRKGWPRFAAFTLLALLVGGGLMRNHILIENRRSDSDLPVRTMAAAMPGGTQVRINLERPRAIVMAAAWQLHYPLTIRVGNCGPEPWYLVDHTGEPPPEARISACGKPYWAVARATSIGASGQSWTLYAQQPLPTPNPAVNSAPPTR